MEDSLTGLIYFIIPGTTIISVLSFIILLITRKNKAGKFIRIIGLFLTMIGFLLTLGLTFLLLAHPYMTYSLIAASVSFLAFIFIYFMKSVN